MSEDLVLPGEDEPVFTRPSNPAADALLGRVHPALDHGFVRLVDYMGGDDAIVQAARTSYGRGTRTPSSDAGLINTLMRDWHTSVFEMTEYKFHLKMPIFVARQWIRHRTACLSGDTELVFDLPGGISRKGHQAYRLTVKEIYEKFQPTSNTSRPDKQRNPYFKRDRVKAMLLRSCNEDILSPMHTSIVDIWECGEKPIIKVDFSNGESLRASKDHLCLTVSGWMKLEEALASSVDFLSIASSTGFISEPVHLTCEMIATEEWRNVKGYEGIYSVSNLGRVRSCHRGGVIKQQTLTPQGYLVVSLSRDGKSFARLVHHLVLDAFSEEPREGRQTRHGNGNRQDNRFENLCWGTFLENAQDRMENGTDQRLAVVPVSVSSFVDDGVEMTYDIEVAGPYHNFIGGGVIVHNSLNEYSGRYSVMDREFYIPLPDVLARQSISNKQGREGPLSPEESGRVLELLKQDAERAFDDYDEMIDEDGIRLSRELARINLPLSTYTQMYWKIDLHNLLNFLRLRMDAHAQYEIRVYAEIIGAMVAQSCPLAWDAFREYRLEAMQLSAKEVTVLGDLLAGRMPLMEAFTSARERRAFEAKLARLRGAA